MKIEHSEIDKVLREAGFTLISNGVNTLTKKPTSDYFRADTGPVQVSADGYFMFVNRLDDGYGPQQLQKLLKTKLLRHEDLDSSAYDDARDKLIAACNSLQLQGQEWNNKLSGLEKIFEELRYTFSYAKSNRYERRLSQAGKNVARLLDRIKDILKKISQYDEAVSPLQIHRRTEELKSNTRGLQKGIDSINAEINDVEMLLIFEKMRS